MSISHKAYLFDYARFDAELAVSLYTALEADSVTDLRRFINEHRMSLIDFGTEQPPGPDWESSIDPAYRVQQYADLALTRYYGTGDDRGLGHRFDALGAYLDTVTAWGKNPGALICGWLFGPPGRRLDPGSMGTGLVCEAEIGDVLRRMDAITWPPVPPPGDATYADCYYGPSSSEEVAESLAALTQLYRDAWRANRGLLLTDYNDMGVDRL